MRKMWKQVSGLKRVGMGSGLLNPNSIRFVIPLSLFYGYPQLLHMSKNTSVLVFGPARVQNKQSTLRYKKIYTKQFDLYSFTCDDNEVPRFKRSHFKTPSLEQHCHRMITTSLQTKRSVVQWEPHGSPQDVLSVVFNCHNIYSNSNHLS